MPCSSKAGAFSGERVRTTRTCPLTSNSAISGRPIAPVPPATNIFTERLALVALPQRLERRAQLRREECRFFPCREVSAAVDLVEVGEARVARLNPHPP